jgi:hypothetical protein
MRIPFATTAWGVGLALLLAQPALAKSPSAKDEKGCGEYGTSIYFEPNPADAAKAAKKDGRLVMVLHISGHFEDPNLT